MPLSDPMTEPRTLPLRMPKGWTPSHPAWASSFEADQAGVAMAVIGFQHAAGALPVPELATLHDALAEADVRDLITSDAGAGLHETLCIAYWRSPAAAETALSSPEFSQLWNGLAAAAGNMGLIREEVNIPFERSETLFTTPEHDHGYSQMRSGAIGPVDRHEYWGGMRDRIPLSAHDPLKTPGPVRIVEQGEGRVVVEAHENLCIIRSGQDWSHCEGEQLSEYVDTIEPTLGAGMAFLRDHGDEVNCYACRYMRDIVTDGGATQRSSGMAYFRSMADLEDWAEHHPTHLKIFQTFLSVAPKYGANLQLRLWHEVSVLPAAGCRAEYINCRPGTGWMPGA